MTLEEFEELENVALDIFKLIRNAKREVTKTISAGYLRTALSEIDFLKSCLEKEIKNCEVPRASKPFGLALNAEALFVFDPEYFDYFDLNSEDGQSEFYVNQRNDKESLLHHLATWVFDDGNTKGALKDISHSFGKGVLKEVKRKLRNREHDT